MRYTFYFSFYLFFSRYFHFCKLHIVVVDRLLSYLLYWLFFTNRWSWINSLCAYEWVCLYVMQKILYERIDTNFLLPEMKDNRDYSKWNNRFVVVFFFFLFITISVLVSMTHRRANDYYKWCDVATYLLFTVIYQCVRPWLYRSKADRANKDINIERICFIITFLFLFCFACSLDQKC